MRLKSDFREPYDHAFDGWWRQDKPEYVRMAGTTRTRKEDHALLEEIGYQVPDRGLLKDLVPRLKPGAHLVAYHSPTKHRAEGKLKVSADSLYVRFQPDVYGCEWKGRDGQSVRVLAVGKRIFWLLYQSKNAFSNLNTESITHVVPASSWGRTAELDLLRLQKRLKEPLVAVDLVIENGLGYAVDLATAPGLTGTPVLDILKPQEIHDLIEARWHELRV